METLPENDRVRYTISPAARKEVLKRLLALNHERARQEAAQAQIPEKGKTKRRTASHNSRIRRRRSSWYCSPACASDGFAVCQRSPGNGKVPDRDAFELNYALSPRYLKLFNDLIEFSRKLIAPVKGGRQQRVHYWTALGLLRGVMSSPSAGVEMLNTRMSALAKAGRNEEGARSRSHSQ